MSLDSLRGWLDRKLTGREMSGFTQMVDGLDSDARGREGPRRAYNNATSSASGACVICRGEHRSRDCPTFRKGDLKRRTELVKEHRLCFSCLGQGHGIKSCRFRKACGSEGCTRLHHPDLHEVTRPKVNYHQANNEIREETPEAKESDSGGAARAKLRIEEP